MVYGHVENMNHECLKPFVGIFKSPHLCCECFASVHCPHILSLLEQSSGQWLLKFHFMVVKVSFFFIIYLTLVLDICLHFMNMRA